MTVGLGGIEGARINFSWHWVVVMSWTLSTRSGRGIRENPRSGRRVWRWVGRRPTVCRMRGFLLERYWPGVQPCDVRVIDGRLTLLSGAEACFVASTLIPADEVVFFEFYAVDDAAVLDLAARADLACDRLVAAERQARARTEGL
jgi:hypothetical protein